jgi:hypothetical protein
MDMLPHCPETVLGTESLYRLDRTRRRIPYLSFSVPLQQYVAVHCKLEVL